MIAEIEGTLESVGEDHVRLRVGGGVVMEVLVPGYALEPLGEQVGGSVSLQTFFFLESQGQGATFLPRLAGFPEAQGRDFYQLFLTCKGIGHRKALRAMALPPGRIAAAIAEGDLPTLQTLPEIGKRSAESITVTLRGKVEAYLDGEATGGGRPVGGRGPTAPAAAVQGEGAREAMEILVQLGEPRQEAAQWIQRVQQQSQAASDAQAIVREVYRLRAGA